MRRAKVFCPSCGAKEDALIRMRQHAKAHGGECLATEYIDVRYSYSWRCAEGHEFKKSFERMLRHKELFHGSCKKSVSISAQKSDYL
jgi:hypothetical protein